MRLGTVSKALKTLQEDLIIERSGGIRILQADKLLAQLAENYEPPIMARRKRVKVLLTGLKLWLLVEERIRDFDIPVVATGLSSVGKYAVMAREDTLTLYSPRIDELQERLAANGVAADERKIATAILGLAHINGWTEHSERIVQWLEQLALDVGRQVSSKASQG